LLARVANASVGLITRPDLAGAWQMTLIHALGTCGIETDKVNFALNATGSGSATVRLHSVACGDSTSIQTFSVTSLSANGSGTAALTCGTGCHFTFAIQVSADRSAFNLVDWTDPNNFIEGAAIHQ
jgi:hypothetical protein